MVRKLLLVMSPLGEELMFRRKQLGLSLEEMAKKIGYSKISRQILYQYESSRLVPTPEIFQRISKVYAGDSADEKKLWRLFWESRAVKLVHDEFDYVEGLFTITNLRLIRPRFQLLFSFWKEGQ